MATPWRTGDGVVEGVPGPAEATAGEEAQHDAVAVAASSPSRTLPLARRSLPAAAGTQARRTMLMAAASSSSPSLPAAAGSEAYQPPATPWVILWRILRADDDAPQDALAGAQTEAQAQHAAAAATPDLTVPLAWPPLVTVVSAGPCAHPDPNHPDKEPFLLYAAKLGLLLEFMAPCHFDGVGLNRNSYFSQLILAHHFEMADGQMTGTVERLTDRTDDVPALKCLESMVLASNDIGEYLIAELQVDEDHCGSATLIYLESGKGEWNFKMFECPSMLDSRLKNKWEDRKWVPHGSACDDRMFWWFDLSWGILSYDASVSMREADELLFHELPDDRSLDQATLHIQTHRCITVSQNKLRYVEIILEDETPSLMMWTWSCIPSGWHWIKSYEMRFEDLWSGDSYKMTRLPRHVPVLSAVCPSDPDLVYFALGQQLFGVNVPELRVAHDGAYQMVNVPWPQWPASSRYVVPWQLPLALGQGVKLEHNIIAAYDTTISSRTQKDTFLAVWEENLEDAFHKIQQLMLIKETNWLIGMDTEFCPQELPPPPWTNPHFGDESYTHMRWSVDEGDLVQIGLAITELDYPQETRTFEFNIHFDPKTRPNNSAGIAFLKKSNMQLEEHASKGIMINQFIYHLRACGLLNNRRVTWITYQGFSDYGYLLRGLEKVQRMPQNSREFLNSVENIFPKSYDLKTFHHIGLLCDKSEKGKANFEALALSLGAERIGKAHTAGSDALLTVRCFSKMVARELPFAPIMRLQGVLFRVAPLVLQELPASCDRHVRVVTVNPTNFQRERAEIHKLFPLYGIVSAELKFPSEEKIRTENYDTARQDLARISAVEVIIAISDPRGWPAYGKLWKFSINSEDNSISSEMLADLLTKVGATSNPSLTWISSEAGLFLYLVSVCFTASLPEKRHQFNTLCSGLFPKLSVVPVGPKEEFESDPESRALLTLRRFLLQQGSNASNLGLQMTLF